MALFDSATGSKQEDSDLTFNSGGGLGIGPAFNQKEGDGSDSYLSIALNGGSPWNQWKMHKKKSKIKKAAAAEAAKNSPQAIQARIARAQWNDFKTRYVPIENKFMQLVRRGEADKTDARGVATSDVAQSFDTKEQQMSVQRVLNGNAVGTSGNTLDALDAAIAKGGALGAAQNTADRATEDLDIAGRQKVVSLGRNLADDANLGLRTGAVLSARDTAGRADAAASRLATGAGAAGSIVGGFTQQAIENRQSPKPKPVAGVDAGSVGSGWTHGQAYDDVVGTTRSNYFGYGGTGINVYGGGR